MKESTVKKIQTAGTVVGTVGAVAGLGLTLFQGFVLLKQLRDAKRAAAMEQAREESDEE